MIKEKAKFWVDPNFDNIELLSATYLKHEFSPHFHEGYAIGVTLAGAQKTSYRKADRILPEGTVCVINPGEIHTGQAFTENGWTYRMVYPDLAVMKEIASEVRGRDVDIPFFPDIVIKDIYLLNLIFNMHLKLEDAASPLIERESLFVWALSQLIIRHSDSKAPVKSPKSEPYFIKKIKEYIEENFSDNITLNNLSELVNISPFHLLRLFKKDVGVPPHIYLIHKRIEVAKKILLKNPSIADVAYLTGFTDQSHLTKRFKRMVGITPGQFIKYSKNVLYT